MNNNKPILCLDFDGVIHSYVSGWQGATSIPDPPTAGTFEFLENALSAFDVVIFSSRIHHIGGEAAMRKWLEHWSKVAFGFVPGWLRKIRFVHQKPPAHVTLDDRAITFTGEWPSIEELKEFRPWYKTER